MYDAGSVAVIDIAAVRLEFRKLEMVFPAFLTCVILQRSTKINWKVKDPEDYLQDCSQKVIVWHLCSGGFYSTPFSKSLTHPYIHNNTSRINRVACVRDRGDCKSRYPISCWELPRIITHAKLLFPPRSITTFQTVRNVWCSVSSVTIFESPSGNHLSSDSCSRYM